MKATVMYAAGDVRVEKVPDPKLKKPTDALLRVTKACICGSKEVRTVKKGDRVVGYRAMNDREAIKVMIDVS